MSIIAQSFDKRQAWSRLYDWDFSAFDEFSLSPDETGIATASVVVASGDGALTLGTVTLNGKKVQTQIGGGTVGMAYTLTCSITTAPNNYPLSWDGIINVVA